MNNQPSLFESIITGRTAKQFFNTIHLEGQELKQAKEQTGLQDQRVLEIFKELGNLTPLACSRAYDARFSPAPCTSIRRSINTLTGQGRLKKTSEMKIDIYGKKNYVWQLA